MNFLRYKLFPNKERKMEKDQMTCPTIGDRQDKKIVILLCPFVNQ